MSHTKILGTLSTAIQLVTMSFALALCFTQTAAAGVGSVTPVPTFNSLPPASNPGGLTMYDFVPTGVMSASAPVVVVLPGCGQTGVSYATNAGWVHLAQKHRFYLIVTEPVAVFPATGTKCFRWYESGHNRRTFGEAASINQMVSTFKSLRMLSLTHDKTYVSGLSGGGAMAAVMLATYPDTFAGGAVNAGIPYGCAATSADATACMQGTKYPLRTSAEWGQVARNAYSVPTGWTGRRQSVALFHGGWFDLTVTSGRMTELMKQWTNYNSLNEALPTSSAPLKGFTRRLYQTTTSGGFSTGPVQTVSIPMMGHGVAIQSAPAPIGTLDDRCGSAAANVLEAGICSSYYSCKLWNVCP